MKTNLAKEVKNLIVEYFSLSDYLAPQAEAEANIREGISFRGMNLIILIVAIFIASLGLNTNSTAVIIGAMLISPLMGPIVGLGLGVGIYDFDLIKRSLRNLAMAAGFSVLTSTLYFLISPVSEGHSELLARTSPTIYDVLIGFFGGAAGILAAGSRTRGGNVVPGVAIATALMPPLCTVGYGIATWQLNYSAGAFYLFLINSVYIALATFVGVKLMNYHGASVEDTAIKQMRRIVYTVAVLVLLPSVYLTYNMLRESNFTMKANRFVATEFQFPSTQVVSHHVSFDGSGRTISVTLLGKILPADSLKLAMASRLEAAGLGGTTLDIIQGDNTAVHNSQTDTSVRDVYQLAQTTIMRQQATIDSLRTVNARRENADTISAILAPELKVLFPQVADIAVARSVFGNVETSKLDTVNVVMVTYSSKITAAQRTKLCEYLEARLNIERVSLVDVGGSLQTDK